MKNYLKHHQWHIIEEGFNPHYHQVSESIFSLGNGRFGLRGNFEEDYSGESLRGSYFAGIYYPDKTRVGWWKNGYPEYFAKVLNSVNWIGVRIFIDDVALDLATTPVSQFRRILDMENGLLTRTFEVNHAKGNLSFRFERFCSMADADTAAVRITIRSNGFDGKIAFEPYLDFDVHNKDANYGDQFWTRIDESIDENHARVTSMTKKTEFTVSSFMHTVVKKNNVPLNAAQLHQEPMKVHRRFVTSIQNGDEVLLDKLVVNLSRLYVEPDDQFSKGHDKLKEIEKHD